MSSSSDSLALPEAYLARARQLLDEKHIDEDSRDLFFSGLQAYLAGDSQSELSIPPETAAVWKDVFKLLAKFVEKAPASPPRSPLHLPKPASEKLHDLLEWNRLSPPQPFHERVLNSPSRSPIAAERAGAPTPVNLTLDSNRSGLSSSQSDEEPPQPAAEEPITISVCLTESDYEHLRKKKQELSPKATREPPGALSSDFKIDEVISLGD
jgi:hypothetical protein